MPIKVREGGAWVQVSDGADGAAAAAQTTADAAATAAAAAQTTANAAATVSNNSDNRVITGTGSGNDLNAESNLTFNGSGLNLASGTGRILLGSDSGNIELKRSGGAYIDLKTGTEDYNVRIDNFTTGTLNVEGNITASGQIRSYFALARVQSGSLANSYNISSVSTSFNRLRLNYINQPTSYIHLFYAGIAQDSTYAGANVVGPAGGTAGSFDSVAAADFVVYGTYNSTSNYTLRPASQIDRITIIVEEYG